MCKIFLILKKTKQVLFFVLNYENRYVIILLIYLKLSGRYDVEKFNKKMLCAVVTVLIVWALLSCCTFVVFSFGKRKSEYKGEIICYK